MSLEVQPEYVEPVEPVRRQQPARQNRDGRESDATPVHRRRGEQHDARRGREREEQVRVGSEGGAREQSGERQRDALRVANSHGKRPGERDDDEENALRPQRRHTRRIPKV